MRLGSANDRAGHQRLVRDPAPGAGSARVGRLASWPRSALFTTTVTRGEIFYGVRLLPIGRRRDALLQAVRGMFDEDLAGQVLAFDADAAAWYAEIAAARKVSGRPISQFDAMIAAVARAREATLASRNVKDFVDCGVSLFDPWSA